MHQPSPRQPASPLPRPAAWRLQPAVPCSLVVPVPTAVLAGFCQRMAAAGEAADLGRMCLDRRYALDCLARAHTVADDGLRQLAMWLFDAHQAGRSPLQTGMRLVRH